MDPNLIPYLYAGFIGGAFGMAGTAVALKMKANAKVRALERMQAAAKSYQALGKDNDAAERAAREAREQVLLAELKASVADLK